MSAETSYIATGPYQDIISGVQLILSFSDGVVKLTGPSGCGRTSLLRELQLVMQTEKQRTILFIPPPKSVQELHNTITRTFSLGADLSFRKALTRFLSSKPRDQQTLFLLIDDADSMDDETMGDLIMLREVKNNAQGLISIVLCGSPELTARLAAPLFAELAKDIVLNYELAPLERQSLAAFCKDAIAQRKLGIPVPAGRTLDKLLAESGGLPGKVLQLLPGIVEEPESEPEDTLGAALASPIASAGKPRLEVVAAGDADEADTDASAAPLISSKMRKALYGGAAMAASVAAVYLLYPVLSPMLQQPETSISSTPATTEVPATAAATTPVADVAQTEPAAAAEPVAPAVAVAEAEPVPVTAPEPATVTEPVPVPEPEPEPAQVATLTPPEPVAVTAPPASTIVSLVPVLPTANLQDDSPAALEALVMSWLTAWQNKDLDQYFQAYHTDFAPLYQSTRAAWRDNRFNSVSRPAAISIAMEEFTINGRSSVGTHVSFWMEYHTATYADRTLKELVIGHDLDGSLRILQEINRTVTSLTPRDFVPGPDISVIASATPATAPATAQTAPALAAATPAAAASGSSSGATYTQIGPPVQIGSVFTMAATATTSSPSITEAQTADINNFLGSWLDSWQHQDIDAYFAHYHPDFKSGLHASREAWQQDRNRKIRRPLAIQIHLLNLQVMSAGSQDSELELQMEYHSTYYADRTVKALRLARGPAGQWLIIAESNQRVEALPLSRLIPGNSITLRGGSNTIFEHAL